MKFDKSRVYTALNADELPIGSKVIVADNLESLKKKVAAFYDDENAIAYITEVCDIISENCEKRFKIVERYYDRCLYSHYGLAYLVAEPESKPKPNHIKCETYKVGDILTDGNIDYMILGIDYGSDSVYLPYIGWCNYFRKFHKRKDETVEQSSGDFEIKQAYNEGTNDMFEFCKEWFKEHKSLPGLVEVDLHLFWHKFHDKFD